MENDVVDMGKLNIIIVVKEFGVKYWGGIV